MTDTTKGPPMLSGLGRPQDVPLRKLHLDPSNPRLPEEKQGATTDELYSFIEEEYEAFEIAKSIAKHGYFPSEPLIVVPIPGGLEFTVVEGNRRLTALRLLADEALRIELDMSDEWAELASDAGVSLDQEIPVVVVDSWKQVAPIIGYRHISGIEQWDPFAKARFINRLINDESEARDFEDVADEVGESVAAVKAAYRNYRILEFAKEKGVDTVRAEDRFGVLTRALTSTPLRKHISVPAPSAISSRDYQPADNDLRKIEELLGWLFGAEDLDPVIKESRDISRLGTAVGSSEGLAALAETRNLDEAFDAAGGLKEKLIMQLSRARGYLRSIQDDYPSYWSDPDVAVAYNECRTAFEELENIAQELHEG